MKGIIIIFVSIGDRFGESGAIRNLHRYMMLLMVRGYAFRG